MLPDGSQTFEPCVREKFGLQPLLMRSQTSDRLLHLSSNALNSDGGEYLATLDSKPSTSATWLALSLSLKPLLATFFSCQETLMNSFKFSFNHIVASNILTNWHMSLVSLGHSVLWSSMKKVYLRFVTQVAWVKLQNCRYHLKEITDQSDNSKYLFNHANKVPNHTSKKEINT